MKQVGHHAPFLLEDFFGKGQEIVRNKDGNEHVQQVSANIATHYSVSAFGA